MKNKMAETVDFLGGGGFGCRLNSPNYQKINRSFFKFNKKAFTLAEVLVTLTIIGVVSAMTIPTLHQRHIEQATINKVKKFYTTMSQAYQKTVVEYGDVDTWGITGATKEDALIIYNNMIKDNFKIATDCGFENTKKCIADADFYYLNGENIGKYHAENHGGNFYYKIILNDGSSVWFRGDKTSYITAFIDTNGPRGTQ